MSKPNDVLPIVEETVSVGKRQRVSGRTRVETVTESVEEIVRADLEFSIVEIERVPVDRVLDVAPEVRVEGDVTIVPVVEEVLVVERRLVLKEEIHITRRRETETVETPVVLRKQRAIVSRESAASETPTVNSREDPMADYAGNRHLSAFFDNQEDAERAVTRLRELGLSDASIRMAGGEEYKTRDLEARDEGGFWDSISNFFFPNDERATYAEGLRRGGYIVTVSGVPEERFDQAVDILDDEGSVDLDERSETWRSEGWQPALVDDDPLAGRRDAPLAGAAAGTAGTAAAAEAYDPAAPRAGERTVPVSDDAALAAAAAESGSVPPVDRRDENYEAGVARAGDEEVIPVVEERLRVGKRDTNLGRVRVRSYVVEEPVSEDVNLRSERVEVERRPVDRAVGAGDPAFTDRTIEAEEHVEEAVVDKEARVTEEIALRKSAEERTETVSDTVRRTEVEVEDDRDAAINRDRDRTSGA